MATDRSKKTQARGKAAEEFVTLAKVYNPKTHVVGETKGRQVDLTGWGIHEKLDGVRARWHQGQLLSRSQKPFPVPEDIVRELEDYLGSMEADGEILCPAEGFQRGVSLVRNSKTTAEEWRRLLEFRVFDVVAEGDYYSRMVDPFLGARYWPDWLTAGTWLADIEREEDIFLWLEKVTAKGGEGLILRDHNAPYTFGRKAGSLLKVKKFIDTEAQVVGHQPGEGKHEGRLGALVCLLEGEDGITFKIGTGFTDEVRANPPAIGSIITCRFFEYTNDGAPRFPVFVGVRDYE
jgi:DNA ligase-1